MQQNGYIWARLRVKRRMHSFYWIRESWKAIQKAMAGIVSNSFFFFFFFQEGKKNNTVKKKIIPRSSSGMTGEGVEEGLSWIEEEIRRQKQRKGS